MVVFYGVDTDKTVTPQEVCNALVECFFEAHCKDVQMGVDDPTLTREYTTEIIKKAFTDAGGNFEKPTKQTLIAVVGKLKDFAGSFRDPSVILRHAGEIMELVEKIDS